MKNLNNIYEFLQWLDILAHEELNKDYATFVQYQILNDSLVSSYNKKLEDINNNFKLLYKSIEK